MSKNATLYKLELLLTPDGRVVADAGTVDLVVLRKILDVEEVEHANAVCHLAAKFESGGKSLVAKLMNEGAEV